MEKKKLIIVEGFDRIGKDTFLKKVEEKEIEDLKVYIQKNNPPQYRNKEEFKAWLVSFLKGQADELMSFDSNIIMARLFTSDFVYSSLFNRTMSVDYPLQVLPKKYDIYQIIFLYKSYEDYLTRCKFLKCEVEYSKEGFEKINYLYQNSLFNTTMKTVIFYNPKRSFKDELAELNKILKGERK